MKKSQTRKDFEEMQSCGEEASYILYLILKNHIVLEWVDGKVKASIDNLDIGSVKFYPESSVIDAILDIVEAKEALNA